MYLILPPLLPGNNIVDFEVHRKMAHEKILQSVSHPTDLDSLRQNLINSFKEKEEEKETEREREEKENRETSLTKTNFTSTPTISSRKRAHAPNAADLGPNKKAKV